MHLCNVNAFALADSIFFVSFCCCFRCPRYFVFAVLNTKLQMIVISSIAQLSFLFLCVYPRIQGGCVVQNPHENSITNFEGKYNTKKTRREIQWIGSSAKVFPWPISITSLQTNAHLSKYSHCSIVVVYTYITLWAKFYS